MFHDFRVGNNFLHMTSKAQAKDRDELDYIKIMCVRQKTQSTEQKGNLQNEIKIYLIRY